MIHFKDELEFKTIVASKGLFPEDKKSSKIYFITNLCFFLFSFPLPVVLLFSDVVAVFQNASVDQTNAAAFAVFYYIGSLALIGMLIVKIQKYEE